jgi:hypothetical protein
MEQSMMTAEERVWYINRYNEEMEKRKEQERKSQQRHSIKKPNIRK